MSAVTLRSRSAEELRDGPVKINLVILRAKFSVHLFVSFIKSFKSPRKMSRLGCAVYSKVEVWIRKAANWVLPCNVGRGLMLALWHYEWQSLAAWRFCTTCSSLVGKSKADIQIKDVNPWKTNINLNHISRFGSYRAVNILRLCYKNE
jgi:hypothetical protein